MALPEQTSPSPSNGAVPGSLPLLDRSKPHTFIVPTKRINEGHDVRFFLSSRAYSDIGIFMMQLNTAMCPRKSPASSEVKTWRLDADLVFSEPIKKLQELLEKIDSIIKEAPPSTGPRRFGNVSFRKWYEILESRIRELLQTYLPKAVLHYAVDPSSDTSVLDELAPYLLGAFGSAQRLDYGTGHELSFFAFLGCIWKLGGLTTKSSQDGAIERSIVLGVIEPYLRLVRRLILTYTLEPAGSHGVWGLDDHSFLPYIFGSSQYCPAIFDSDPMPVEGALPESPDPADIAKRNIVDRERKHNMYFAAIGFINDVKTGAFWEHSPVLFDISGVKAGWGKINKGMIKMYNAEVLSKFPVVQHFPFGSLFLWEQDPNAEQPNTSVHAASQPKSEQASMNSSAGRSAESTRAPWASPVLHGGDGHMAAPWAQQGAGLPQLGMPSTRVPWAPGSSTQQPRTAIPPSSEMPDVSTRAPWASK